jgi:hypothetical protein
MRTADHRQWFNRRHNISLQIMMFPCIFMQPEPPLVTVDALVSAAQNGDSRRWNGGDR